MLSSLQPGCVVYVIGMYSSGASLVGKLVVYHE